MNECVNGDGFLGLGCVRILGSWLEKFVIHLSVPFFFP